MDKKDNNLIDLRPEDFKDLKKELRREGKSDDIKFKSLNIIKYPGKRLKRRFNVRYRFNPKHLIVDIAILITVVLLIATNVFYWYGGFHYFSEKVNLQVSTTEVVLGQETEFVIKYQNDNKFDVQLANLTVTLPENFILTKTSRTDYDWQRNYLHLGTLQPGANNEFRLSGLAMGDVNKDQRIGVNINYYKSNKQGAPLWGQFQVDKIFEYSPEKSALEVNIELPEKFINEHDVKVPLVIKNNFSFPIEEVRVVPKIGNFGQVVDSDAEMIEGVWYFYQVEPGQEIVINPLVNIETAESSQEIELDVFMKYEDKFYKQFELKQRKELFNPHFLVFDKLEDTKVELGETVNFEYEFHNYGEFLVEDVQLQMEFVDDVWDLENLEVPYTAKNGNVVTWTQKDFSEFVSFDSQTEKTVSIPVKLKNDENVLNSSLKVNTFISYKADEIFVTMTALEHELKMVTGVSLRSLARYYSPQGDQLGRGPLPPMVGDKTTYWVFLHPLNDAGSLKNVQVTAELADDVSWEDNLSVTAGDPLKYDTNSNVITWNIAELGLDPKDVNAAFEVGLRVQKKHVGQIVSLVKNIKITAEDSVTGEPVSKELPVVTNELLNDELARDQGWMAE